MMQLMSFNVIPVKFISGRLPCPLRGFQSERGDTFRAMVGEASETASYAYPTSAILHSRFE